jgi:hypothetical protein
VDRLADDVLLPITPGSSSSSPDSGDLRGNMTMPSTAVF